MRPKNLIRQFTPAFIERFIRKQIDAKELRTVNILKCNPDKLCITSNITLSDIFDSPQSNKEWDHTYKIVKTFNIPDGTGGINPGDRKALFYLIKNLAPSSVLEIGTHIGASTTHIAAALSSNILSNITSQASLTSVDLSDVNNPIKKPWLNYGVKHSPIEMINSMNLGNMVSFIKNSSLEFLSECTQQFDLIFLDGNHSAKTVYQEVPAALNLLKNGGIILLHDYFPKLKPLWSNGTVIPGPYLATERLKAEGANLIVIPLGKLPWKTKLNSNMSSLALLLKKE